MLRVQDITLLMLLCASANAQSFNLDVGPNLVLWPEPSSAYGAGAAQPGMWNAVQPSLTPWPLLSLSGQSTQVLVVTDQVSSFTFPMSGLSGDDDAFTADGQALDGVLQWPARWTFAGLEDGSYDVYTYAWDSTGSGALTEVSIPNLPNSAQTVGGFWNGSPHVIGVTYALHQVTVFGGVLEVDARSVVGAGSGQVIGFQLVQTGSGSPFTAYCFGDSTTAPCPCANGGPLPEGCKNSSGSGAVLSGVGSTSVGADNQIFSGANLLPNQPALLFVGDNAVNGGEGAFFGDGLRCAGGNVVRLGVKLPDASGSVSWGPGLAGVGGWSAGEVRRFQLWYRDPVATPCGFAFNLSNGLEVGFTL